MFVELEYQPALEDFRTNGEMELRSILKLFENTGNKHSDIAGDSILGRANIGKAWVFTDWMVQLKRYPKYGEKIVAKTWSEPVNAIFSCSRDFVLYCNDELVVKATTRWAIVDLTLNRPMKIEKEILEKYLPEEKKTFEEAKLPKISIPETYDFEKEIVQRRSDIDFNNHVHNLTYLDYAFETIPADLYKNRNFKNVRISYKMAIFADEKTTCKYACRDNKHIFGIYGNEDALKCQIELS